MIAVTLCVFLFASHTLAQNSTPPPRFANAEKRTMFDTLKKKQHDSTRGVMKIHLQNTATKLELEQLNSEGHGECDQLSCPRVSFPVRVHYELEETLVVKKSVVKISAQTLQQYRKIYAGPIIFNVSKINENNEKTLLLTQTSNHDGSSIKLDITENMKQIFSESAIATASFVVELSSKQMNSSSYTNELEEFMSLDNSPTITLRLAYTKKNRKNLQRELKGGTRRDYIKLLPKSFADAVKVEQRNNPITNEENN